MRPEFPVGRAARSRISRKKPSPKTPSLCRCTGIETAISCSPGIAGLRESAMPPPLPCNS
jgi:hypothetical protein